MALMEPMPDPSLKEPEGEKLEVEFKAAKWGIAARMSGGPVVLTKVKAGGEGESLGLKIGDIIVEINGVSVTHRRSTVRLYTRRTFPPPRFAPHTHHTHTHTHVTSMPRITLTEPHAFQNAC